jgi:hypothetical protein
MCTFLLVAATLCDVLVVWAACLLFLVCLLPIRYPLWCGVGCTPHLTFHTHRLQGLVMACFGI